MKHPRSNKPKNQLLKKYSKNNIAFTHDGNFWQRIKILSYKKKCKMYHVQYEDERKGDLSEDNIYKDKKEYLIKKLNGGIIREIIPQTQ